MAGLWIDDEIMKLKRTPAERLLLARICYRAGIAKDELCHDSNKELALAIDIHAQTASDLVQKLEKDGLINTKVYPEKKNERTISPIRKILIPYKENADRYKEKTDSDYKEIPYSTPETLSGNSLEGISQILIGSKEIPDSYNKDIKPLENLEKSKAAASASSAGARDEPGSQHLPAEQKPPNPPVAAAPQVPKKKYGDGKLQQLVKAFIQANPDKYETEMYVDFLEKWTAIVDDSKITADIGKELWRTQDSFSVATRLKNWHPGYLKDQQKPHESATRPSQSNHSAGKNSTGYSGKPVKRLALIPPGSLSRFGKAKRDEDPQRDGGTIRIDVGSDHGSAGDQS
ncbi:MarR family transcriptional regulator [Spirosoma agri]|uniref:MarR family transcriptional regulator n=1 Tax=Spirosoma agri TaxID=1987381 RepID=A0A6M0IKU4_9BACT|nr:MarR family transcriptional regulator [Spirosoma agri]NEU68275.1 MarR family transcriptional regulator [Spirosoma agri]